MRRKPLEKDVVPKSGSTVSHGDIDYAQGVAELAKAMAQLRVIDIVKKNSLPLITVRH